MGYIVIFKGLGGIPNVAVLVQLMVQVQYGCKRVLICFAFKTRQWDESLGYASEPVVKYSITPSIVMHKRKILNCRKKKLYLIYRRI